jgi:hypothetical protein
MADDTDDNRYRPRWDAALAASLVGKYVIAGFIHLEPDGVTIRERVQVHGIITEARPDTGFVLALRGSHAGETLTLPPNTQAFAQASPGRYRLHHSGEVVFDPDYTSLWTITTPRIH